MCTTLSVNFALLQGNLPVDVSSKVKVGADVEVTSGSLIDPVSR